MAPLRCFGRDLVLFRGHDGAPHVMDARCSHLGAHLAVGGRVEDSCIRCPFHGWKFDGTTGDCVDVPYEEVEHIPARASMRAFPTIERTQIRSDRSRAAGRGMDRELRRIIAEGEEEIPHLAALIAGPGLDMPTPFHKQISSVLATKEKTP